MKNPDTHFRMVLLVVVVALALAGEVRFRKMLKLRKVRNMRGE